jgi:hypothetical protein
MAWRDGFGMELTWQVGGAYANWTLTVQAGPPEHLTPSEYRDEWRETVFSRLHLHFVDLVNLLELGRQMEMDRRYGVTVR